VKEKNLGGRQIWGGTYQAGVYSARGAKKEGPSSLPAIATAETENPTSITGSIDNGGYVNFSREGAKKERAQRVLFQGKREGQEGADKQYS